MSSKWCSGEPGDIPGETSPDGTMLKASLGRHAVSGPATWVLVSARHVSRSPELSSVLPSPQNQPSIQSTAYRKRQSLKMGMFWNILVSSLTLGFYTSPISTFQSGLSVHFLSTSLTQYPQLKSNIVLIDHCSVLPCPIFKLIYPQQ